MPNDRTRLPLPEPHGQFLVWDYNAKPNDPVRYRDIFTADQMHAYYDAAYRAGLEAAAYVLAVHQIPVGNSAAGELACQWTYDALKECRDEIRALKVSHD